MSQGGKLIEAMRTNPRDWKIEDVERVCATVGLRCEAPKRGSHYKVSHPALAAILTVPYNRPIKPIYIRELVRMIEQLENL